MVYDLDTIDRRILAFLREDGRMPSSQIAGRIGTVSQRSVRYHVERLRRSGVLCNVVVLDPLALGYTSIKEEYDWRAPVDPAEGGAPMR